MPLKHPAPTPHLILGGARSGKSSYAESLVTAHRPPYLYIATAEAHDDEMKDRIRRHQQRRKARWETIEAPLALPDTLKRLSANPRPVLVDCLTLWLSNMLLDPSHPAPEEAVEDFCGLIRTVNYPLFLVSNEVGAGIVPENHLARQYRDLAGFTNQRVAQVSRAVTLVVAGLPLRLK